MSNTELAFTLIAAMVPAAYFLGVSIGLRPGMRFAEELRRDLIREKERAEQFRAALQAVKACSGDELAASIARDALNDQEKQ